ncbi:FxLYD domain-containing protein [Priestia sp. SIMBA_032]|uniref:FxLYD domain-containing protein n=1 Tax=Priestia sp. SIMBA_032 TaxID=3085775 RepID=UPI00397D6016
MRKLLMVLFSTSLLALSACGGNEISKEEVNQNVEDDVESVDINTEVNEEPKLKTADEASYAIKTEFTKEVQYYAVIKNTGKVAADLDDVVITYTGKDGSVIAMDEVPYVAPYVLKPNQEAYVMSSSPIDVEPEEFDKAEMNISAIATGDNMVESVDTSNTKMSIESDQTEKTSDATISGKVINTLKDKTDVVLIGGALYDENDKLLATTYDMIDSVLSPNQSVGFESSVQDVPMEVLLKAKKLKVNASYYPEFE